MHQGSDKNQSESTLQSPVAESFEIEDDEKAPEEAEDEDARLRHLRARRGSMARDAVKRGRDWSLIGSVVLVVSALQLILLAFNKLRSNNISAGVVFCLLTVAAFTFAAILFRRYRRLSSASRKV